MGTIVFPKKQTASKWRQFKIPGKCLVFVEVEVVTNQLKVITLKTVSALVFLSHISYNKKVVVVTVLNFLFEVGHEVFVYRSVTTHFRIF